MKKLALIALCALISTTAFGQLSFHVRGGAGIATFATEAKVEVKEAFKGGVGLEYAFTDLFALRSSIMFSTKGAVAQIPVGDNTFKANISEYYVEVPVLLALRFNVSEKANLILSFGPYFAYGAGGKTKLKGDLAGYTGETKWDTFGDNGLKRFDAGSAVGLAVELGKLSVGFESEFGFVKLSKNSFLAEDATNVALVVGVGYRF